MLYYIILSCISYITFTMAFLSMYCVTSYCVVKKIPKHSDVIASFVIKVLFPSSKSTWASKYPWYV